MPNAPAENYWLRDLVTARGISPEPLTRRLRRALRNSVCPLLALLCCALPTATASAQPAKAPVKVVQTNEGVIELSNRPAPATPLGVQAPALAPARAAGVEKRPAAPSGTSSSNAGEVAATDARSEPPGALGLGWWAFGVAVLVALGGLGALASHRKRQRRAREELSAILADSVPLERTEAETSSVETDAPAPRSRGNAPQPPSERQWLSQPPSSYKNPTR